MCFFKKKKNVPILLNSIENILEKTFAAILENLKSFYKNTEENYLYMTLMQDGMVNPIRSACYVLQSNQTERMVEELMTNFNRYVNSNESVSLESSFQIYFKVVSSAAINFPHHRRKTVPGKLI